MNNTEEKIFKYLEISFWDEMIEYNTAEDVLEKIAGNSQDCSQEIRKLIEKCLKGSSKPSKEDFDKEIADLKKKQNQKNPVKNTVTNIFPSEEIKETSEPKPNDNFANGDLIEYLQNHFWSQKTTYQSSSKIIECKFSHIQTEDVHPKILDFMDELIKNPTLFESEKSYQNTLQDLISTEKRDLPSKGTRQTLERQIQSKKAEKKERIPHTTQVTETNELIKTNGIEQAKVLDDVEFLVEYREIDIKPLESLIRAYINSLTDFELTMPNEEMDEYYRVEKIHVNDTLGLWSYDHFQDCITICLRRNRGTLPKCFIIMKKDQQTIEFRNYNERKTSQSKQFNKNSVTLKEFLADVVKMNQKEKSYTDKWLKAIQESDADKLDEILAWDERDWFSTSLKVNAIKLIRNHLNQFRTKSNQTDEKKKLTESEKCAVTHRIRRFLNWKTKSAKDLEQIKDLDEEALALGFKEIREKYVGEPLLKQLETFYTVFTIPKSYSKSLITNRGMLLYGPPGNGKTLLTDILPSKIGLTPISYPLCASEVNRSLVGETERLLFELVSRAEKIPYLLCCLAIDEIDGLAPKRDGNSSQHKMDTLAMLLSVIGGIKDVSNLTLLASTNRLNQMDDAFKRRMSGQFFVGRPSPVARKAIIKDSEATHLTERMIDQVVILSTNFSGAALKQYISYIISEARNLNEQSSTEQCLPYDVLADIAAKTSKQFNIRLGNHSLPELFLLQKQKENVLKTSFLKWIEDQQAILIFKENLVEIEYRRWGMESPTLADPKSEKTFELKHLSLTLEKPISDYEKFIETLLLSRGEGDVKKRIQIEKQHPCATEFKEDLFNEVIGSKVSEIELKAKENQQRDYVLLWPDLVEKSNQGNLNKDFVNKWFQLNSKRLTSVKNLYHIYRVAEADYKKLCKMISWQPLKAVDKEKLNFSGRILADLSEEDLQLRFELNGKTDTYRLHSEPLLMENSVTNSSQVIPKLVEFASERGIDFILLMDQDFLLTNNAFDESKIKENITEKMQEFKCYEKSLLIVDVDSLVGMAKSVSESSMGISNSYSLSDSKLYHIIIHFARSLPKILPSAEYWVALISKNKELSNMIKHDLSWPRTLEEQENYNEEKKKKEQQICLRCNETYTEDRNDFNNCLFHNGYLFEASDPSCAWKTIEEEEANGLFLKGILNKFETQNGGKQVKEPQFLYICCLQPLRSPGCKKHKHTCETKTIDREKMEASDKYSKTLNEYRKMVSKR